MRILATIVCCATLVACAAPGYQASLVQQVQDSRDQLHSMSLAPYKEWLSEKPVSCSSPTLKKAADSVLLTADMLDARQHGFSTVVASGGWILEVAEGAKDHGCKQQARRLYDAVISSFVGNGYASLRQRASVGIDDLRQMPDKPVLKTAIAQSKKKS